MDWLIIGFYYFLISLIGTWMMIADKMNARKSKNRIPE